MGFLSGLFGGKPEPEFDIEKAAGEHLLKLPQCSSNVVVVSPGYGNELLICTETRSNRARYLHSTLTHLRRELSVRDRLFKVVPAVHVSVQMVGHFSVEFNIAHGQY